MLSYIECALRTSTNLFHAVGWASRLPVGRSAPPTFLTFNKSEDNSAD
jgi:hypothetical protein